MTIQELMKALAETDDPMERMRLIEDNKALWENVGQAVTSDTEDYKQKYDDLVIKYRETFFNGSGEEKEETTEDTKTEDEKKAESITIDDVVKGGK